MSFVLSNATRPLPNPFTPMAFFDPKTATIRTGQNYATVGALAILLWDILLHLPQDYKLATRYRINISFIIYCIARVTSLAYLLGLVIMTTAPVGNCSYIRQISILYPFTLPLTIVPFVMRVSALYRNNKYVVAFFSISWLAVLGCCIALPVGVKGSNIGSTRYCLDDKAKIVNALSVFFPFIHDSLIFLATSWALARCSYDDVNKTNGLGIMVLGRNLPAFSKSILRDGQFYYLVTLILNVFFIVLFYIPPSKAIMTPCTIGILLFVMLNTMSSYVYRNMRLGYYKDYTITSSVLDRALQKTDQTSPLREIVFKNKTSTNPVDTRDLERGNGDSEEKVGELVEDVTGTPGKTNI